MFMFCSACVFLFETESIVYTKRVRIYVLALGKSQLIDNFFSFLSFFSLVLAMRKKASFCILYGRKRLACCRT